MADMELTVNETQVSLDGAEQDLDLNERVLRDQPERITG